jgi:hypothetical protein
VALTTHPIQLRGERKSTVISLLSLWAFIDCSGLKLHCNNLPSENTQGFETETFGKYVRRKNM